MSDGRLCPLARQSRPPTRRQAAIALATAGSSAADTLAAAPQPQATHDRARATLRVGPDREMRSIAEAASRARDGDTIEIDAGAYPHDAAVWTQDELTIRAVGGPVRVFGDGAAAEGKGLWVVRGGRIRIEGFEFRGARVPAGNGAGIRFEAGSLVLARCRFLDNEMGVLTAGRPDMSLTVHGCTFGDAPRHDSGQLHHLLYVGAIGQCVVMHSRFFNGFRGHLLKSRARVNRILFNELVDGPDGEASYELEFPEGGDNLVQGNRIEQSARTQNPALLSMGAEAGGRHGGRLVLRGNRFVNRFAGTAEAPPRFVHLWPERLAGPLEVVDEGNEFEGPGLRGLPP